MGLPGIIAAGCGSKVYLSDFNSVKNSTRVHSIMESITIRIYDRIAEQYSTIDPDLHYFGYTWGQWNDDILNLEPNIIIAADCFYDNGDDYENILSTVVYLLEKSEGMFITTYQNRGYNNKLLYLIDKWGLCTKIASISSNYYEKYETNAVIDIMILTLPLKVTL
eukprot:TRINITY_DN6231_c0_g1_i4.p1 TRINITY_DN6231_c0_g1~~TRINITY_DN6231_c0_g1_i4.p1  ORF type:complete len:165 (-),score=23.65 TRINITY_DN6231_c0_g1_i4:55-549(-)